MNKVIIKYLNHLLIKIHLGDLTPPTTWKEFFQRSLF